MRPYAVNPVVGDIEYELPHYYCQLHKPDPGTYPIDPAYGGIGDAVGGDDIIMDDPEDLLDPDITDPPVIDSNPWGDENNGNTDGNTSTDGNTDSSGNTQTSPVVEQPPPDWL